MAEDIPGFPSLPLLNLTPPQTTRSLQQSIVVSTAPTTSPLHPASCVLKDEESNASKQSSSFCIKQNKRPAPEVSVCTYILRFLISLFCSSKAVALWLGRLIFSH